MENPTTAQPLPVQVQPSVQRSFLAGFGGVFGVIAGCVVLLIICVVCFVVLTAYSANKASSTLSTLPSTTSSGSAATPNKATTTVYHMNQAVPLDGQTLTVLSVGIYTPTDSYMAAKSGNKYVVVEVIVENTGSKATSTNPLYFTLQDKDSYSYNTTFFSKDPSLKSGDIPAGSKSRGFLTFEIPESAVSKELTYTQGLFGSSVVVTF